MRAEYVLCPHCRQRKLGPYIVDTSNKSVTRGTCLHCGKRYRVEYGKGRIVVFKE